MSRCFAILLLALLHTTLIGCSTTHCPPLQPGMSGVEVRTVAEPKRGAHPSDSSYGSAGPAGAFQEIDYSDLPDVVVWAEPLNRDAVPATSSLTTVVLGEGSSSKPPVQGVSVGSRLIFRNQTDRTQTIYSVSEGNDFDLGSIAPGGQAEYVVRSQGLIEVLSEADSQPIARLYAAPSPWVRTLRSSESACLSNLPPGEYRVACWHERLPGSQQIVSLVADKRSQVTLTVSVNLLPPKN